MSRGQQSISSMTGGSRVAQGATLITTCKADRDNSLQTMKAARIKSKYDIEKYEMCLTPSSKKRKIEPYAMTISRDFLTVDQNAYLDKGDLHLDNLSVSETMEGAFNQVLLGLGVKYLDRTMTSYYRDVYDARTDLELFLAQNQISLHGVYGDDSRKNTVKKLSGFLHVESCRRNSIIFATKDKFETLKGKKKKGEEFKAFTAHPNVYLLDREKHGGVNVFVFLLDGKEKFEDQFMFFLKDVFSPNFKQKELFQGKLPCDTSTVAANEKSENGMVPATYYFQGFSLGHARMDTRDGDNVYSCLRSGAMTVRNGPFQVIAGDQMMWIRHSELIAFDMDGNRKIRNLCTIDNLKEIIFGDTASAKNVMLTRGEALLLSEGNAKINGKCDPTGALDSEFHTFIVAPLRSIYSSITGTGSLLDHQRRVGSAISNAGGSAMVDLLIGSDM